MNSRKANETFYQNNTVELSDEAMAAVTGGSIVLLSCDQSCHQGGCSDHGCYDNNHGCNNSHDCNLLGNLLCNLL